MSLDAAEIVFLSAFGFLCFLAIGFFVRFLARAYQDDRDRDRSLGDWQARADAAKTKSDHNHTTSGHAA
jgi:hypothetical protein